jgi:hypothetical protein
VRHFGEASWLDFVRNMVSPNLRIAMQQHIDDGCKKCAAAVQLWQSVFSIATQESTFTPPADTLRVVKSQFVGPAPEVSRGVRLLFDSRLAPITAGVRGALAAQQFLYETEDYCIDLRVHPRHEACVYLVGQVLNRTGIGRTSQGLTVRLQEGKRPIAETSTNQFGEFQLEFNSSSDKLYVSVNRDKSSENEVVLPLYGIQGRPPDRKNLD